MSSFVINKFNNDVAAAATCVILAQDGDILEIEDTKSEMSII